MHHLLIQESEEPERNPAAGADLGVIDREVTVRDIGNLFEGLSFAADFEEMLAVDKEISLLARSPCPLSDIERASG